MGIGNNKDVQARTELAYRRELGAAGPPCPEALDHQPLAKLSRRREQLASAIREAFVPSRRCLVHLAFLGVASAVRSICTLLVTISARRSGRSVTSPVLGRDRRHGVHRRKPRPSSGSRAHRSCTSASSQRSNCPEPDSATALRRPCRFLSVGSVCVVDRRFCSVPSDHERWRLGLATDRDTDRPGRCHALRA